MKQWPKNGSKVMYVGTQAFWFTNIVEDANNLLETGKQYTVSKLELASSWCAVILDEYPDHKFSLSWFVYPKDLTTEEVQKTEAREAWDAVKYEFTSLQELQDRKTYE